jgi:hypothetical protein
MKSVELLNIRKTIPRTEKRFRALYDCVKQVDNPGIYRGKDLMIEVCRSDRVPLRIRDSKMF